MTQNIHDEKISEEEIIEEFLKFENPLSEQETRDIIKFSRNFLKDYAKISDKDDIEQWITTELKKELPNKTNDEVSQISLEITKSLQTTEEMKTSLQKAKSQGRSSSGWLSSTLKSYMSKKSLESQVAYLEKLDTRISRANEEMLHTIKTSKSNFREVSQNRNLDGFIAEQQHVNLFNLKAAESGSDLRASVVQPKGSTYTKNGFDIVIKNEKNKIIHQYQLKYGKTAQDTIKLLEKGDYRNQILVVPENQVAEVSSHFPNKTVQATIGEGKNQSVPLTKDDAKKLQDQVQNEKLSLDADWSNYSMKEVSNVIVKNATSAGLMGAAIGAGTNALSSLAQGESIESEKVIKEALVSGADMGIKSALAGALKVASEKGMIRAIPKGTPPSTIANIAFVAVENVKAFSKVASGEYTIREGIDAMCETTTSCVAGLAVSSLGAASLGAAIGTVLGPVGAAVGSVIGGAVGYAAGSSIGKAVTKVTHKVRNDTVKIFKSVNRVTGKLFSGVVNSFGL
ncbi:hypothetical protein [Ligilactobacillus equi]|nr:hypothetical protein [Ligilactobacillus equi]